MNKLNKLTFSFVATAVVVFFNSVCFGSESGNLEYWQTSVFELDINKHFTFTAAEEFRLGRHNGNPYLYNVDLGLVYKGLANGPDIGLNFKKEYEKDSTGKLRQENRPHLNITFKGTVFDFATSNRTRLEYRNREKKEDLFRLRNKTTAKLPFKFTKFNLQPFVADELFLNLGENNVNQNRLSAGFSSKPAKNINVSVYYMWKTTKITGGWSDTNVIGTQFKVIF